MSSQMYSQPASPLYRNVDPYLSLCFSVFIVFVALRLFDVIDWSWWLVCIPLFVAFVPLAVTLVVTLVGTVLAGVVMATAGLIYFVCVEPWTKRKNRTRDAYWSKREADEAAERETSNR